MYIIILFQQLPLSKYLSTLSTKLLSFINIFINSFFVDKYLSTELIHIFTGQTKKVIKRMIRKGEYTSFLISLLLIKTHTDNIIQGEEGRYIKPLLKELLLY
jgi:hypothetical protein